MSAAIVWKIDPFASEQSDESAQSGLKRGRGFNNVTEVLLSTKMGQFSLCCCGAQRLKSIASRSTLLLASPICAHLQSCVRASIIALPIVMSKAFLLNSGNLEKIFTDVNKCFKTESPKRRIFLQTQKRMFSSVNFSPNF